MSGLTRALECLYHQPDVIQPPPPNSEISPAMQEALRFLQAGKTVEAEETLLRHVRDTRAQAGIGTYRDAAAHGELGSLLLTIGQLDRAIDAFGEAVAGPMPTDRLEMRDRLTFLMNLGQALQKARRFEEASDALQTGLEGRENFYGRAHPGYAFGLEPLAEVIWQLDKRDMAIEMMEEVVANFWRNGHPRVAGAIAIRAEMRSGMAESGGKSLPAFGGLDKLPNDVIEEIARQTISRVGRMENLKIGRRMLAQLVALLDARLGQSHPQTTDALITISNIERKLEKGGDPSIRRAAIQQLITIFDKQNRPREALQAVLGLALAHSDVGDMG
jgi:tetratricopeptide (TPR) repeat protein